MSDAMPPPPSNDMNFNDLLHGVISGLTLGLTIGIVGILLMILHRGC